MNEKKVEHSSLKDQAIANIEVIVKGFPAYITGLKKIKTYFDKRRYFNIKENGVKAIADVIWLKELDVPLLWHLELLTRYIFKGIRVIGMFLWGYLTYRIRKILRKDN